MWVFDGEEWRREGEPEEAQKVSTVQLPRHEEMGPALQILEITPTPRMPEPVVVPMSIPTTDRKPR